MEIYLIAFFILGYVAITMEHSLKLDKLIPALLMMVACWTLIAINVDNITYWIDADGISEEFTGVNHLGIEHVNKT
ncbi:MAG: sodium:proton antiporter, partial [Flavobacteriia bacterium]|nr:sodium:proton antiporter [Flavobacteriia bacterium]